MLQNILAKAMGVDKKVNQALYEFLVSESGIANVPLRSVSVLVSVDSEKTGNSNPVKFSVFIEGGFVRNADIIEIVESQQEASLVGDKIYEFLKSEQKRLNVKQEELNAVIVANSNMQIRLAEIVCGNFYDDFTIEDVINGSRPSNYQEPAKVQEQKIPEPQSPKIPKKPNPEDIKLLNQSLYQFLFFEAGKLEAPISDVALFVSMVLVEHPQVPDALVAFPRFNVMHGNDHVREALIVEILEEKDAHVIGSSVVNFFISESERTNMDVSLIFGIITAEEKENEVKCAEFCDGQFYDMFTTTDLLTEQRPLNYQKPS